MTYELPDHIVLYHAAIPPGADRKCLDCFHVLETASRTPTDQFGRYREDTICPACGAGFAWTWYPAGLFNGPVWNLICRLQWPERVREATPVEVITQPRLFS